MESEKPETGSFINFKSSRRKRTQRKLVLEDISEKHENEPESSVRRPVRMVKNFLIHRTKSFQRNKAKLDEDINDEVESVTRINYKVGDVRNSRELATASNEIDTSQDRDAIAVFERHIKHNQDNITEDGFYHGQAAYKSYIEKKDSSKGPARASSNVRVTTRWDYAPDICKDYKETGFCGFGDSCKFLHDRSDYKFGWQIEQEYQDNPIPTLDDKHYEVEEAKEDGEDEQLPFACFICRNKFVQPIVTKCGHYFCESCALEEYKRSTRCFACGNQTYGIFNPARDLEEKLKKLEERLRQDNEDNFSEFEASEEVGKEINNECDDPDFQNLKSSSFSEASSDEKD